MENTHNKYVPTSQWGLAMGMFVESSNPSMDKHDIHYKVWDEITYPFHKLQRVFFALVQLTLNQHWFR